jgi:hypothetical protein
MRHYAIVTQVRRASLPLENSTGQEQALYVHQEQIENDKVHKSVTTFKDTHIYIHISVAAACHFDVLKETIPDNIIIYEFSDLRSGRCSNDNLLG